MAATLSTINDYLRNKYLPGMQRAINHATILRDKIKAKKPTMVGGKQYSHPIHVGRNESTGSYAEGDYLPSPGNQTYDEWVFTRANISSRFKVSGNAIDASRGPDAAAEALDEEMKGAQKNHSEWTNVQMHLDGSGLLATCVSASDAGGKTTIVLRRAPQYGNGSGTHLGEPGTLYLRPRMKVDVVQIADGLVNSIGLAGGTIESVDHTAGTITLTATVAAAASIASTFGIYKKGTRNKDPYGLKAIVSTSNPGGGTDANGYLGAINRSTAGNDFAKATVIGDFTTGRALSIDAMMELENEKEKATGESTKAILCDHYMWRKYGNLIVPDRRWASTVKTLDGGWQALEFNGIPVIPDRHCLPNRMLFLDWEDLLVLQERALSFMDEDGAVLNRVGSGDTAEDAFEGTLIERFQMMSKWPQRQGGLFGLV